MYNGIIDQNVCPISLETYDDLRSSRTLVCTPCSHLFQDISLMQWLTVKESCPLCRKVINLDDLAYGEVPKETLLKKIQNVFFSIIGGVKDLFTGIGNAIKEVFSNQGSFMHDRDIEAGWPLVLG